MGNDFEIDYETDSILMQWLSGIEFEYLQNDEWIDYNRLIKKRCTGIFEMDDVEFLRIKRN